MSTPYKDYELSIIQYISLKMIRVIHLESFYTQKTICTLLYCGFIHKYTKYRKNDRQITCYKRTIKGEMYVRYRRRDFLRYLIPITISLLSLFKSYDIYSSTYLEKILQALSELIQKLL